MMKLTGRNAALALRRWCEAAEMQAAQTAAIDRRCRDLFCLMHIGLCRACLQWSSSSWQRLRVRSALYRAVAGRISFQLSLAWQAWGVLTAAVGAFSAVAGLVMSPIGLIVAGIAVAVLMSATSLTPAAMRATMIVLFLFTDLYALAWAAALPAAEPGGAGLLGAHTLAMALALAPAMLAGIWCGRRFFIGLRAAVPRVVEHKVVAGPASSAHVHDCLVYVFVRRKAFRFAIVVQRGNV
jgi:hypothetical protein